MLPIYHRRPLYSELFSEPQAHYALVDRYGTNQTVIRVRRSSDNAETDVTSSQVGAWLVAWVGVGNDGFVVTWYDLTTNGNDATQATSTDQPKIVDSGALVTEGGLSAIEFDGIDDYFSLGNILNLGTGDYFFASVLSATGGTVPRMILSKKDAVNTSTNAGYQIYIERSLGDLRANITNGTSRITNVSEVIRGEGPTVVSVLWDRDGDLSIGIDGTVDSDTDISSMSSDNVTNADDLLLGENSSLASFLGTMQEVILYDVDQSANRAAINRQLGADYALSVYSSFFNDLPQAPQAHYALKSRYGFDQTVVRVRRSSDNAEADFKESELTDGTLTTWTGANDGFVVTWYDLTVNGNNATQATSTAQPQIVDAGALVTEGGAPAIEWDGVDDYLTAGTPLLSATGDHSIFLVSKLLTIPSANSAILSQYENAISGRTWVAANINGGVSYFADGTDDLVTSRTTDPTDVFLLSAVRDSATSITTWWNGGDVIADTGTGVSINQDDLNIGGGPRGNESYSDLRILEAVLYDTDQSANRAAIDAQLMADYSIS